MLRSGCWRKLNFERSESKAAKANETHGDLLSNPWILRFSSARNTQGGGECHGSAERVASASHDNDSDRKKAMSRWGASASKQFRFYRSSLRRQDSNGGKTGQFSVIFYLIWTWNEFQDVVCEAYFQMLENIPVLGSFLLL